MPSSLSVPPVRVATCNAAAIIVPAEQFQSTPPVRVATLHFVGIIKAKKISIHATRAGGDQSARAKSPAKRDFNPRHPCGWRLTGNILIGFKSIFQSTPPVRVATSQIMTAVPWVLRFQSTPPVRVATRTIAAHTDTWAYFNPRHPCGWRQIKA